MNCKLEQNYHLEVELEDSDQRENRREKKEVKISRVRSNRRVLSPSTLNVSMKLRAV